MFDFVFKNFWRRLLFSILIGLAVWFLLEIILNLRYRNYVVLSNIEGYFEAVLMAIISAEALNQFTRLEKKKIPWER